MSSRPVGQWLSALCSPSEGSHGDRLLCEPSSEAVEPHEQRVKTSLRLSTVGSNITISSHVGPKTELNGNIKIVS